MNLNSIKEELKRELNIIYYLNSNKVDDFFEEFLNNFNFFDENNFFKKEFLENIDVPFFVIYKSLNVLKKYFGSEKIYKIEEMFSKVYLKNGAVELLSFLNHQYNDRLLFIPHNKFIKQIYSSLFYNDLSLFPKKHFQDCEFQKVLKYPKSKMILCSNIKELENLHNIMHIIADALYKALKKKKFSDAIFILENFKEGTD
ncbi:MAG: hypothetical protein ABGX25_05030 [Nautiliaceae bacterium]